MKIAIVHEMLIKLGGAERVLEEFITLYPEADVYTLMYDEEKVGKVFPKEKIHCTGPAQRLFQLTKKPRLSLPLMPFSIDQIDVSGYDLVISSSSGFAHQIAKNTKYKIQNTKEGKGLMKNDEGKDSVIHTTEKRINGKTAVPIHICYCHSPARYLWDWSDEVQAELGLKNTKYKILFESEPQSRGQNTKEGIISLIKKYLVGPLVRVLFWWLRRRDQACAQYPDLYIANSREVQQRIQKYYHRDSEVIWPPVDTTKYMLADRTKPSRAEYYVMTSALTPFKRVDIPVRVLSALQIPLKIIGSGDQRAELEALAGPTVEFLGRVSDQEMLEIYAQARGFLMPQKEDAGIAPIEAMAAGLPVFGQAAGGLLESSIDGVTGEFFSEETDESFREGFLRFHEHIEAGEYDDTQRIIEHAEQFGSQVFNQKIRTLMNSFLS